MAERQKANGGWVARWREHRRAKRQQAAEREYFEHERASAAGSASSSPNAYQHRAPAAGWLGFGGDGGSGCSGGDGGGC